MQGHFWIMHALNDHRPSPITSPAPRAKKTNSRDANHPPLPPRFQKPYNICTSDYQPFVACAGMEPSEYDGLQIALFKKWAKELGWTEADYVLTCLPWGDMMDDIRSSDGHCFLAAAGG